ncbi:hypothetical protein NBRC116601_21170 [Cognatishimia sp. WU-CL00825]|uniref:hypothetical protein n=1 Tax=Cognatishimia sp. WU-CL00825 TaxID=3127658 RepID=UPI0031024033
MRAAIATTLGYAVIVFPLAFIWHLTLFEPLYLRFGYFDGEPNIPLGFLTIFIQGAMIALLYPHYQPGTSGAKKVARFVLLIGLFHWSLHVLALMAKQNVPNAMLFLGMESLYLVFQFGLTAIVLFFVHERDH